jgi:A/G-specific adenine glycosylase
VSGDRDNDRSAGEPGSDPARLRRWLAPRLLAWFAASRRDLPWRRDRDPYRIWVSEVMLQQTQVATVIPYFERFLARFPTLADLAAAQEQEVLRLWEGLGYYRRARDLLAAARLLNERHAGAFPSTRAALLGLPGMGEYTRNAVLSQAFDLRLPILEVNTQRVLSRLFGREEDPRQGPARRWLWQAAADVLPARRAGEVNQALMELGSLLCTPAAPRCGDCPLAARCSAHLQGRQEEIPPRAAPKVITEVRESAVAVRRRGKVLLVQRPATGRWASLWELPHADLAAAETHEQAARRAIEELTGVQARLGPEVLTMRHGVTRFRITLVCFEAEHEDGEFHPGFHVRGAWVDAASLGDYPVSSPQRKLARALLEPARQRRLF